MFILDVTMSKKRAVLMSAPLPTAAVPDVAPVLGGSEALTQGGKTFMDKVSELESRFSKKKKRNTTKKPRRRVSVRKTKGKNPKRQWYKRNFQLDKLVKKPRKTAAAKRDDRWFLSRKTTLNSLINKMKIAKIPLSQLLS